MRERTAAQYLKAIWLLQVQCPAQVTVTSLSYWLSMAPATVSQAIKELCVADLVQHERYGPIALTAHGQHIATVAVRKERVARAFLFNVLEVPWPRVAEESSRLSTALSTPLAERMYQEAGSPDNDPYGNPIPGWNGHLHQPKGTTLVSHDPGETLRITRVAESNQDLLERFHILGLIPNSTVQIKRIDYAIGVVRVSASVGEANLGLHTADRVYAVLS